MSKSTYEAKLGLDQQIHEMEKAMDKMREVLYSEERLLVVKAMSDLQFMCHRLEGRITDLLMAFREEK